MSLLWILQNSECYAQITFKPQSIIIWFIKYVYIKYIFFLTNTSIKIIQEARLKVWVFDIFAIINWVPKKQIFKMNYTIELKP